MLSCCDPDNNMYFFLFPISVTLTKTVKMEYLRRGRPLRKTGWGIREVSRYMRFFLHGKGRHEDIGTFAKFFSDIGDDGMSPFPEEMMEWERVHHKVRSLLLDLTKSGRLLAVIRFYKECTDKE